MKTVLVIDDFTADCHVSGVRRNLITDGGISFQTLVIHPFQHGRVDVHIIIDTNIAFVGVQTMKSAGILRYSSLPGYGHGQKQRIKPCFVKALADVFAGCAYDQGFVGRRVFQHFKLMRGLRRTFAAGERHYIFNLLPEQICQGINMRRPLAENQAVSVFVNAGKDIIHNAMIPKIVLLKPRIVFADSHGVIVLLVLKARAHESGNQKVRKWVFFRLRFCIYPIADRPQIHVQNGMMTILSGGGCGQAVYILRTNAFECLLKADCRHMMTFVDDDHAVVADPRFDCVCVSKQKKPEGRFWNGEDVAGTLTVTSDRQLMPDKGRLQCVIERQDASVECLDTRQVDVHDTDLAPTLIATDYKGGKAICYENHAQDSRIKPVEVSQSIVARMGTGGGNLPLVKEPDVIGFIKNDAGGVQQGFWKNVFPTLRAAITPAVTRNECFHLSFCDANGTRKDRKNGGLYVTKAETSQTVTAKGPHTETVVIALDGDKMAKAERKGGSGLGVSEDGVMYTQTVKDVHAVAYDECVPLDLRNATRDPEKHDAQNRQGIGVGEDGAPMNTVTAASVPGVGWQATVRKLLPIECERLMGFPDNWTRISWKGKPEEECPDAPRYKACGNSMCVNVMAWIGERIEAVNQKLLQMK